MLKDFWLFQRPNSTLQGRKQVWYWVWNALMMLLAGVSLGFLSLLYAYGNYATAMMRSYLEHPLIAFLNIAPVVVLLFSTVCWAGRGFLFSFRPWWCGDFPWRITTSSASGTTR